MKINEVITEAVNQSTGTPNADPAAPPVQPAQKKPGLWNKLKAGVANVQTGMQQRRDAKSISQSVGAQANRANTRTEIESFTRYLDQALGGQQPTAQALQKVAGEFARGRYSKASEDVLSKVTSIKDLKTATNYIAQSYNSAITNRAPGGQPVAPAAQSTQPPPQAAQEPTVDYSTPAYQRREKSVSKPEYHPASTDPIDPKLLGNNQVQVAGHGIITKGPDGQWRDEQEDVISRPADIKELERRLTQRLQTKQMANPPAPFQPGAPRRPRNKRARKK